MRKKRKEKEKKRKKPNLFLQMSDILVHIQAISVFLRIPSHHNSKVISVFLPDVLHKINCVLKAAFNGGPSLLAFGGIFEGRERRRSEKRAEERTTRRGENKERMKDRRRAGTSSESENVLNARSLAHLKGVINFFQWHVGAGEVHAGFKT